MIGSEPSQYTAFNCFSSNCSDIYCRKYDFTFSKLPTASKGLGYCSSLVYSISNGIVSPSIIKSNVSFVPTFKGSLVTKKVSEVLPGKLASYLAQNSVLIASTE